MKCVFIFPQCYCYTISFKKSKLLNQTIIIFFIDYSTLYYWIMYELFILAQGFFFIKRQVKYEHVVVFVSLYTYNIVNILLVSLFCGYAIFWNMIRKLLEIVYEWDLRFDCNCAERWARVRNSWAVWKVVLTNFYTTFFLDTFPNSNSLSRVGWYCYDTNYNVFMIFLPSLVTSCCSTISVDWICVETIFYTPALYLLIIINSSYERTTSCLTFPCLMWSIIWYSETKHYFLVLWNWNNFFWFLFFLTRLYFVIGYPHTEKWVVFWLSPSQ